jgi:hypothetical protein
MQRDHYVFGYEAEPADERPTGFGQTNFGRSDLVPMTQPSAWTVSQHSTFDAPSRAIDRVEARRRRKQVKAALFAFALLAVAAIVCAAVIATRT